VNEVGELIPWSLSAEPSSLWGIDPNLRMDFQRLQPFMRKENPAYVQLGTADPSFAPLAILNSLWNIDKHRHINLTVFNVGWKELFGPPPAPRMPEGINRLRFVLNLKGWFETRTEFGRLSWDSGPVPAEVSRHLKPTVFFDIAFEAGPPAHGGLVTQVLDGLLHEVASILQKFEPYLA